MFMLREESWRIFFLIERFLYFLCAVKVEKYLAQVRVYQGPGASRAVT